jgi:hypothetical protein
MQKRKEARIYPDKLLNPDKIRINLLLSSLFLSAFEVLKLAIVDKTKGFFVFSQVLTDLQVPELGDLLEDDTAKRMKEQRVREIEEYEKHIGAKFYGPDQYALIPSCVWLHKMGGAR